MEHTQADTNLRIAKLSSMTTTAMRRSPSSKTPRATGTAIITKTIQFRSVWKHCERQNPIVIGVVGEGENREETVYGMASVGYNAVTSGVFLIQGIWIRTR